MNSIARLHQPIESLSLPTSRSELTRFLGTQCLRIRADHYLVAEIDAGRCEAELRIVASNWTFDTIEALGAAPLAETAAGPAATYLGSPPQICAVDCIAGIGGSRLAALAEAGHAEFACIRLRAGRTHYFVLYSAAGQAQLDAQRIPAATMSLTYALSALGDQLADSPPDYPISERERECLGWVAEGKTTMDIAMILGVSSNTINSYLAHVIQKLSARNRAMAIAVAIRSGII